MDDELSRQLWCLIEAGAFMQASIDILKDPAASQFDFFDHLARLFGSCQVVNTQIGRIRGLLQERQIGPNGTHMDASEHIRTQPATSS